MEQKKEHRFQPGQSGNLGGRPKGAVNKSTIKIKEAFHNLLENNLDNISLWLGQVAAKDPQKAIDLTLKLSEFIIPKLARQEIVGQDGTEPVKISFNFSTATSDEQQEESPQGEGSETESTDSE
jgi:hypothetical protein